MKPRDEMKPWIIEALRALGGAAPYIEVYKFVWTNYRSRILRGGDYWVLRWQYELSFAASELRKGSGRQLKNNDSDRCPKGIWALM